MLVNLSRYLTNGLVGKKEPTDTVTSTRVERLPLTTGTWAFVFSNDNIYIGEGTWLSACSHAPL